MKPEEIVTAKTFFKAQTSQETLINLASKVEIIYLENYINAIAIAKYIVIVPCC